jgi:hypothetical protein
MISNKYIIYYLLNMAKDPLKELGNFFKKIGNFFKAIGQFFDFIFNIFKSIFSYIMCGFKMIITLPLCFKWYSLDILGKTLYSPIGFLFFVLGLKDIEKMIWNVIQQIDCFILSVFGRNAASTWEDATKQCYSCKIIPIPKFPKIKL